MTYVLVAENFPEKAAEKLKAYGQVVRTKANTSVLRGLDTHPDILVHPLPNGDLVVDRDNFDYYKEIFKDKKVLLSHSSLSAKYPGYDLVNIKQGYAKCSCLVTHDFVITSDGGIYESLKGLIPIYKIDHGQIKLQNFNYGFIGGATGVLGKKIFFTGDFSHHSSYEEILKIINKYDYEIEILSDDTIEDFGSIYFI